MIVSIPEDIYGYESKSVGNFTLRQVVCFCIALAVIAPTLALLYLLTGSIDLAATVAILLGMPVLLCGFIKQDGQPLEKVIRYKLLWKFKYPHNRPYQMDNLYQRIEKEAARLETEEAQNASGDTAQKA